MQHILEHTPFALVSVMGKKLNFNKEVRHDWETEFLSNYQIKRFQHHLASEYLQNRMKAYLNRTYLAVCLLNASSSVILHWFMHTPLVVQVEYQIDILH